MNVYMIREDGEDKIWKAATMRDAIKLAEDAYVLEELARVGVEDTTEEQWRSLYSEELLESCTLLGELANP